MFLNIRLTGPESLYNFLRKQPTLGRVVLKFLGRAGSSMGRVHLYPMKRTEMLKVLWRMLAP